MTAPASPPARARGRRPRAAPRPGQARAAAGTDSLPPHSNDVRIVGRLAAPPTVKLLPSETEIVQLRVIVDRPLAGRREGSPTVDTIDVSCWSAASRRQALRCNEADTVEVTGALRRRFWRTPTGAASRYEVEAARVRIVRRTG